MGLCLGRASASLCPRGPGYAGYLGGVLGGHLTCDPRCVRILGESICNCYVGCEFGSLDPEHRFCSQHRWKLKSLLSFSGWVGYLPFFFFLKKVLFYLTVYSCYSSTPSTYDCPSPPLLLSKSTPFLSFISKKPASRK